MESEPNDKKPAIENRQLGAYFGLAANIAVFANGLVAYMHGDNPQRRAAGMNRMATGALWTIPSILLARYGAQPTEKQFDQLQHKLSAYLQQEGVSLDAAHHKITDEEQHKTLVQKLERFAYNHPLEINYAFIGLGSAGMMRSGLIRQGIGENVAAKGNVGVSALSLAAALAAVFIPEKTDEQLEREGKKDSLWGKLQKQPISYANILMLGGDIGEGVNSLGEFQAAKALPVNNKFRPYGFLLAGISAATMVTFLVSDSLVGFGSKKATGKPEERAKAQEQLVAEAAYILSGLPPEERAALIRKTAEYMAKQPELRMSDWDASKLDQALTDMITNIAATEQPSGHLERLQASKQTQSSTYKIQ